MSYSAEELIRLSFPQNGEKILTLHKEEKRLVAKSFELSKQERCLFQSLSFGLSKDNLTEHVSEYKADKTERDVCCSKICNHCFCHPSFPA